MIGTFFAALLALVLGLGFAFVGYRLFLVFLPIWGFFAGFWLGLSGTQLLFGEGFFATVTGLIIGLIVGLICAVLAYLFFLVGVVIVAGAVGAALGGGFMAALGFESGFLHGLVAVVVAVVVIGLTLLFNIQKYVIIAITAIGGANLLVLAPLMLFGRITTQQVAAAGSAVRPVLQDSWLWLIVWLVIAAVGIAVQVRTNATYTFTKAQYAENW